MDSYLLTAASLEPFGFLVGVPLIGLGLSLVGRLRNL